MSKEAGSERGIFQRRSGEMPPDRRSSGKQKRLHTLLPLICLRVLSTAGSVSLTLLPPCWPLYLHLIPPAPPQPPPFCRLLDADPVIRRELTSGGPAGAGSGSWGGERPETEADSAAETASTQAVGTRDPAQADPVAPHIHQENRRRGATLSSLFLKRNYSFSF